MPTKPIPVRIPEEWLPRLDAAAKRLGTNRARLIAFCAQTFAESFERLGVSSMPPNWEDIFAGMDGRTSASKNYALGDKPNSKVSRHAEFLAASGGKPTSYRKPASKKSATGKRPAPVPVKAP